MKLDSSINFINYGTAEPNKFDSIIRKLPSAECMKMASILIALWEGEYYVLKSRWILKGDPGAHPGDEVDPMGLDFVTMKLQDLRDICNPGSAFKLPEGFTGANILLEI